MQPIRKSKQFRGGESGWFDGKTTIVYAAMRNTRTDDVEAYVIEYQTRTSKHFGGYISLSYRITPEDCGPAERNCPRDILAVLTPTDNDDANEWRAACSK